VKPVYGAAGRIGLVVPANNSVIEPELWSVMPAGCAAYATRLLAKGDLTPEAIHRMERDADGAVAALAATGVDVIAYCDMVTTFIMAPGWNEAAVQRFAESAATPCISAWTALRDALAKLKARRLAIGTPYPASIHALVPGFFAERGFEVKSHATLDILAMRDVPMVDAARLRAFVSELNIKDCDALVLLATDLPTFASIAQLERNLGVAVLTSNQAILWRALTQIGVASKVRRLGALFE
jgi:maleate isomerase